MPSPIVDATWKAAFLTFCSTIVATFLTPKNPPIIALVVFAILATPPNFQWQQYLERKLPGYTVEKNESGGDVKERTPTGEGVTTKRRLNVMNTVMKVIIDQTLGAAVNVALYLGGVRALQGVPLGECLQVVKEVSVELGAMANNAPGQSHRDLPETARMDLLTVIVDSKHGRSCSQATSYGRSLVSSTSPSFPSSKEPLLEAWWDLDGACFWP
ncbi:MAG: hypothetical protein Q9170_006299 [Blastenia crenularia]